MAFPAADLRLRDVALCFFAEGAHLHTLLKHGKEWTHNLHPQFHVLTGVGARNIGHRAGLAQIRRPLKSL